jgi:hypothetical protein
MDNSLKQIEKFIHVILLLDPVVVLVEMEVHVVEEAQGIVEDPGLAAEGVVAVAI